MTLNLSAGDQRDTEIGQREYAYILKVESLDSESVNLSLHFPPIEKAAAWDLPEIPGKETRRKAIHDIRCDEIELPRRIEGGWESRAGCSTLSWKVSVPQLPWLGYDASRQTAVKDSKAPWMFLPGAAIFLVSPDVLVPEAVRYEIPAGTKFFHSLDFLGPSLLRLPAEDKMALVTFGLGNFEPMELDVGGLKTRYLLDRKPKLDFAGLARHHADALAYLMKVTRANQAASIDVFWFRRSRLTFRIGGAAGYRSLCVNYLEGLNAESKSFSSRMPLFILLHEQFHLINRGDLPAWFSEGLAQYYALKAVHKIGLIDEKEFGRTLEKFIGEREPSEGLLSIQHRIDAQGDMSDYRRLYSQGIFFWHEVDALAARKSNGTRSLDDFLPELLAIRFSKAGDPAEEFREILIANAGETAYSLYERFITGQGKK